MSWMEPTKFVAICRSIWASLASSAAPKSAYPALLTTTSMCPTRWKRLRHHGSQGLRVSDIEREDMQLITILCCQRFQSIGAAKR